MGLPMRALRARMAATGRDDRAAGLSEMQEPILELPPPNSPERLSQKIVTDTLVPRIGPIIAATPPGDPPLIVRNLIYILLGCFILYAIVFVAILFMVFVSTVWEDVTNWREHKRHHRNEQSS